MDVVETKPTAGAKRSILHPTDFSAASHTAFTHALRLALASRTRLTLVHVGRKGQAHWTEYPGIRETLSRWGVVDRNAGRSEVVDLGITASKVHLKGGSRVRGVIERATKVRADLIVLAAHRRGALLRWIRPSVSLGIVRTADVPCLLLPSRARGFVDRRSGEVAIRKVLLPVSDQVDPVGAIRETVSMLSDLGLSDTHLVFLHINGSTEIDASETGAHPVEHVRREGEVVEIIDEEARTGVDLVVMTSLGHDSTMDRLVGSTTERVVERVRVPLLVIPGGL